MREKELRLNAVAKVIYKSTTLDLSYFVLHCFFFVLELSVNNTGRDAPLPTHIRSHTPNAKRLSVKHTSPFFTNAIEWMQLYYLLFFFSEKNDTTVDETRKSERERRNEINYYFES